MVRIVNYAKSPERGAKSFEMFLDQQMLYRGDLRKCPAKPTTSSLDVDRHLDTSQTILLTHDPGVIARATPHLPEPSG